MLLSNRVGESEQQLMGQILAKLLQGQQGPPNHKSFSCTQNCIFFHLSIFRTKANINALFPETDREVGKCAQSQQAVPQRSRQDFCPETPVAEPESIARAEHPLEYLHQYRLCPRSSAAAVPSAREGENKNNWRDLRSSASCCFKM